MLVLFFSITAGSKFLTLRNWTLLLEQLPVLALVSLGMTFVITAGFIDLSVGSALGMASLMGALAARWCGLPGLLLGIATGIGVGFVNGVLFNALRIPSFIATLATMVILRAVIAIVSGGFAVYLDQVNAPGLEFLVWLGRFPQVTIITLAIAVVVTVVYSWGVFGQNLKAIGGDERAVARFGVPVGRYRVLVMTLSGAMVGLASVISLAQFGAAGPLTGTGMELEAISAVVLGGTPLTGGYGSTAKTLVGALALVVLADGLTLTGVSPSWTSVVRGVILIVAVTIALERRKIGIVK
jgi:ribose transport system permease protein